MIIVALLILVLSAIPILIYLQSRYVYYGEYGDKYLFAALSPVAFIHFFCLYDLGPYFIGDPVEYLICAVMILHWAAWLWMSFKHEDAKAHVLPLLTVWALEMAYSMLLGSDIALIAATLYGLVCIYLYKPQKAQEDSEILVEDSAEN